MKKEFCFILFMLLLILSEIIYAEEVIPTYYQTFSDGQSTGIKETAVAACQSYVKASGTEFCYMQGEGGCIVNPAPDGPTNCDFPAWRLSFVHISSFLDKFNVFDPYNDLDPQSCPGPVGNPVDPVSGNKYQIENIFNIATIQPIQFDIYFNSKRIEKLRHSYSRSVKFFSSNDLPRHDFTGEGFGADPYALPESNGGFGYEPAIRGNYGAQAAAPVMPSYYPSPQSACQDGWTSYKSNYHYSWAAGSTAEYIGNGRCRILDSLGIQRKIIDVYSKYRGRPSRLEFSQPQALYLRFSRHDGSVITFQQNELDNGWDNLANNGERAENSYAADGVTLIGYRYFTKSDEIEDYDLNGHLLSITTVNDHVQSLNYNVTSGMLEQVVNETGEAIDFTNETFGTDNQYYRIQAITDHTGRNWGFRYDALGNLEFIDNPDTTTRQYHYEDVAHPYSLTGITDERGLRYATWAYNADGKATLSAHGEAADKNVVTITYETNGNRTVTKSRTSAIAGLTEDIVSTYKTHSAGGRPSVAEVSGPGCSSCGSGHSVSEYNAETGYLEYKIEYGVRTEYGNYDAKGNPGFIIEAAGTSNARRIDYTYDLRFHDKITTITEPSVFVGNYKVTTYTYDDFANTTSVTIDGFKPDGTVVGRSSNYQYTAPYHQLSQIDGPRSDVNDIIDFEYYSNDSSWGNNRARLRHVMGADGVRLRSSISYTATGKVSGEYRSNNLYLVGYNYSPDSDRLVGMLEYDMTNSILRFTNWTYLPTGEVQTISQAENTTEETTLTLDYDDARRLTRITGGLGNYIKYILDSEGNVEKENIHDVNGYLNKTLTQTFDNYDRLDNFSELNSVNNSDYNADGTLDKTTDGKGQVTDYNYDSLLRLTQVVQDQGGADPTTANALTQYGYDVQDNLTSVTDAKGGQTIYVYDDLGNLLSQTSPDTGSTAFTHDEAGNIATQTDAKVQLFTYSYDHYNRLTALDAPGTDDDVNYVYDTCAGGYGKLCSVTRKNSTTGYQYNAMGDVLNVQQGVVSWPGYNQADTSIDYSYDGAGRVKTMIYPSGAVVAYAYDAAGQVSAVMLDNNGVQTSLTQNITYNPFGPAALQTRGNGLQQHGIYYDDYRPFIIGEPYLYFEYTDSYDQNGNPLSIMETYANQNYSYDAHDRVDTSSGVKGSFDYDYDTVGNKTQYIEDGVANNIGYDANGNRMNSLNTDSVAVDANGNITSLRGMALGFAADNRLKSANTGVLFEYNGLGQRSMKKVTAPDIAGTYGYSQSVVYLYGLNGELLAELGPTGKVVKEYIYMDGKPLAILDHKASSGEDFLNGDMDGDGAISVEDFLVYYFNHGSSNDPAYDVNGDGVKDAADNSVMIGCGINPGACEATSYSTSIYYIHNDHLGTPKLMSNELGVAVWRASATPFGKASVNDDVDGDGQSVTLNIRQPGQYYDRETGFYYNYFRYYDPETGRYITSDPIGLAGGINTYAYVENNPLRLIDPLGLWGIEATGVVGTGRTNFNGTLHIGTSGVWATFGAGIGTPGGGVSVGVTSGDPTPGLSTGATVTGGNGVAGGALNGSLNTNGLSGNAAFGWGFGFGSTVGASNTFGFRWPWQEPELVKPNSACD